LQKIARKKFASSESVGE